jgi:hypothetical protein
MIKTRAAFLKRKHLAGIDEACTREKIAKDIG